MKKTRLGLRNFFQCQKSGSDRVLMFYPTILHIVLSLTFSITLSSCDSNLYIKTNCKRGVVVEGRCFRASDFEVDSDSGEVNFGYLQIRSNADPLTNMNPIKINIESVIYKQYRYKFVGGDISCEGEGYGEWLDISSPITKKFSADGSYKICVLGRNQRYLKEENATSKTWTIDTQPPLASLTNAPVEHSNSSRLSVEVATGDLVEYQFKITDQTQDCSGGGYNGNWIPTTTPITETLGFDGNYRLCVIGRDLANNIQDSSLATVHDWIKDTNAPVASLSNVPTNPSNDSSLNVIVAGIDVAEYQYKLIPQVLSCAESGYNGEWIPVTMPITAGLDLDGEYKICVIGRDIALNAQLDTFATSHSWIKDSTPPDAIISGDPFGVNAVTTLNVSISGTDVSHYRYKLGVTPLDCTNSGGYSTEADISAKITDDISGLADGDIKLCVVGRDILGNYQDFTNATQSTWTKDTLAPVASLSSTPSDPSNITSLNVTVGGVDVFTYQYKVVAQASACTGGGYNGSWINVGTSITDSLGADADYKLCVIGRDMANNAQAELGATTHLWTKDTFAPLAASVSLGGTPTPDSSDTNLNVTVGGTDIDSYQYKVVAQGASCDGGGYNGTWIDVSTPITDPIGADGDYKLCVITRDTAMNEMDPADAATFEWTKDTAAPTVSLSNTPSDPSNISNLNVTVGGSGVVDYKFKLVAQAAACTGGGYSGSWIASSTAITSSIGVDGDYKLCVLGRDAAFNEQLETSATTHAWTKDTVPPVATVSGEPTGISNVTVLDITVSGTDVIDYQYKVGDGSTDCSNGVDYSSDIDAGTKITDDISGIADGLIILCLRGRDAAYNSQAYGNATSVTWTKDTIVPTATLSGAPVDPSWKPTLNVTVAGAGVVDYQYKLVSQATACTGGGYNGSWTPVATPITDAIGIDGDYKLCVIGRDLALNAQSESSATSHSWTKTPLPSINIDLNASSTSSTSVTLALEATDATEMYITNTLDCNSGGSWETYDTSKAWTLGVDVDLEFYPDYVNDVCKSNGNPPDYEDNFFATLEDCCSFPWIHYTTCMRDSVVTYPTATVYVKYRNAGLQESACINDDIVYVRPTPPTATLSGVPVDPSWEPTLNVTVAGTDVVDYQYKLVSQATACTGGGYNGSWTPVATPITDAIGIDGDYKLCVIGRDIELNAQYGSGATSHSWTKTPLPSINIDLNASSTASTSVTLTLAATDASEMYITNTLGCSSGGSWETYDTSKAWTLGVDVEFYPDLVNNVCKSDGNASDTDPIFATLEDCCSYPWLNKAYCENNSVVTNPTATVYVKYRNAGLQESACINDDIVVVPLPDNFLKVSDNLQLEHENIRGSTLDANGRLLVWGAVTVTNSAAAMWRFNADGSVDTSFGNAGRVVWSAPEFEGDYIYSVKIKEDGSLRAVGYSMGSGKWRGVLGKFDENGQPDTEFSADGFKLVQYDVDRVRYLRSGGFDSQDRVLLIGTTWNDVDVLVIRADADGVLDTTFAVNGYLQWDSADAPLLGVSDKEVAQEIRADGGFLYLGVSGDYSSSGLVMKLDETDGSVVKVTSGLQTKVYDFKFHSGNLYFAGYRVTPTHDFCWGKLGPDLELDGSYGTNGETCFTEPTQGNQGRGYNISISPSGEAFIGGLNYENSNDGVLVKASSNGNVDSDWGNNGWISYSNINGFDSFDRVSSTIVTGDKVYVVGQTEVDIGGTEYSRLFINLISK